MGYKPGLDGIRAVAIGSVVLFHFGMLRGGWAGVDIFFVLSGFLITRLLLEERDRTGSIALSAFYGRRVRRLLPALALFIAAMLAATAAGRLHNPSHWALYALTYSSNFFLAAGHQLWVFTPLWSLAQEEQFYLLWPPILILVLRRGVTERRLMVVLLAATVAVAAWRDIVWAAGSGYDRIYYSPDTRFDPLLVGCLLAVAMRSDLASRVQAIARRCWPAAAAGVAVIAAVYWPLWALSTIAIPATSGCAALVIVAALQPTALARILSTRVFVAVGAASYSIYLWHEYLINAYPAAAAVVQIAVVAAVSYFVAERPFTRRRKRTTARRAHAAVAARSM